MSVDAVERPVSEDEANDEAALFAHAAAAAGVPVPELMARYRELAAGPGRLLPDEYIRNGLHLPGRYTDAERAAFLASDMHWPIVQRVCDMSWYAAVDDKALCESILRQAGVPVPATFAVTDRTVRQYPGLAVLRNAADLAAFLRTREGRPFFAKPIRGMGGHGAILVTQVESAAVHVHGYGRLDAEAFWEALGPAPYMFQEILRNHPALSALTPHLATVRLGVFVYDDLVTLAYAVLKIPAAGNVIDSPLRPGNIVCNVADPEGTLRTIITASGMERVSHDAHPDTGVGMLGLALPFWADLRAVAARAAVIFAPLRYQSMDVAITPDGPVVVEVNSGGSLGIVQRATLAGFLQPHVRHFLDACGVDLEAAAAEVDAIRARKKG